MTDTAAPSPTANSSGLSDLHKAILDSANYAIIATDATGIVQVFNRAAERMFGYTAEEIVGKQSTRLWQSAPEVQADAIRRGLIKKPGFDLFAENPEPYESVEYELMCTTKDGRHIPVLSSVNAVRTPTGVITGYLGIGTDLTVRKAVEEKVRQENAFRLALETSAPIAIATANLDGKQTYVNPTFCKMVGYSAEELIGKGMPRVYWHPNGTEMLKRATDRVLNNHKGTENFELMFRRKDGSSVNVYCYVSPLLNDEHETAGWLAVYFDITERKQVERTLFESEARFRSYFAESASGMSLVSPDGRWIMVNKAACNITGYTEQELLSTTFQAITYPDDLDKDLKQAEHLLAGEISSYQMEKRYIHKTGRLVWIDLTVSLVHDAQGKPLYFCSQFQDISQRKQTDEQLRRAKDAAEAANQAKSNFLANISHEIRTPLNAIAGFAEVLERGDIEAKERQEFAQTIRRNSEHLLNVLNDILDVSRIEAGRMTIEMQPVALRSLLEDVYATLHARAESKGLKFHCKKAADLPSTIVTDPTRLRQILLNLVGNAVKFTDVGSVTILASVEAPRTLKIEVVDTGLGIPPEQQRAIFEPFTQVDVSHSRRFGGVGLGLAISKRLAGLLGGEISLHSHVGRGSTFTLRLQINEQTIVPIEPSHPSKAPIRSVRVLVAEDSIDSQRLLQFLLEKLNLKVDIAANGQAALDLYDQSVANGTPYELVIMDMQMPVLDGYTATPLLRQRGYAGPLIVLTANATAQDRDRCLGVGCDEFLSKPVQLHSLEQTVRRHFGV